MSTTRCFLAIPLEPELRQELTDLRAILRRCGVRWLHTHQYNLHLTLLFLGDILSAQVKGMVDVMNSMEIPDFTQPLPVGGLGAFPGFQKNPKILWAGVGGNWTPLQQLHKVLSEGASKLDIEVETRPYHPHITIARPPRGFKSVLRIPKNLIEGYFGLLPVRQIILFKSELDPSGPVYKPIHTLHIPKKKGS
jgi:RNA 2',3'-cyclic 3'-phosphodiesterase